MCHGISSPEHSCILALPGELRTHIFSFLQEDIRCRKPVVILDTVCISSPDSCVVADTAVLLVCRLFYAECLPVLYDSTTVEMTVRSESDWKSWPSLGPISDCGLLHNIRHLELEVSFNSHDDAAMSCVWNRLQQLAEALNGTAKLKTLKLAFFHQDQRRFYRGQETPCDSLLTQAASIQTEKLSWISRNIASREAMSPAKWQALRSKVHNLYPSDEEQFQEISMDYWDPISQLISRQ